MINNRKQQIVQKYHSFPATFYMWVDEMARQLRFNLVSGHITELPFGCHIDSVESMDVIWQFLKKLYDNEEIKWEELEFFEDDGEEENESYVLQVYVKFI